MKINEIIRAKRLEKGLTQEQVANRLGVSAPAVNKWEKGASYPDITLLPALARLLDTDLNTLLSFQSEPTREEIGAFLDRLTAKPQRDRGIRAVLELAEETLRQYPSCDLLALNTALALQGLMMVQQTEEPEVSARVEALFRQAAESLDPAVSRQAKAILVSTYTGRKEFDPAKRLLDELPDADLFDKTQLQANLYIQQGALEDAARIMERKLLSELNGVQSTLTALMELALKEGRGEEAREMADVISQLVRLTGMWEYGAQVPQFQLALAERDAPACIAALEALLAAAMKKWDFKGSLLFRHIPAKEPKEDFMQIMLPALLREIEDPKGQCAFLQGEPGLRALVQKYRGLVDQGGPMR